MGKNITHNFKKYLVEWFNRISGAGYLPVVIYAIAFIVRLIFILEIENEMFFNTLMGDPSYYDSWAKKIAGGDLIGKGVWEMSPLYPYLLALIYKIFGHGYLTVRFFQVILGSSTCLLVFYIGEKVFSRGAGLTAALIAIFTGPLIFYDGLIIKTTTGVFLLTLFVYLLVLIHRGKFRERGYLFTGMAFGLLCLSRENALILIFLFLATLLGLRVTKKISADKIKTYGLLFLTGLGIIVLPVTLRNYKVGKDFVLITSKYGETFYEGNNPNADGTYSPPEFIRPDPFYEHADFTAKAEELTGRSLRPSQVANFWMLKGFKFIIKHPVKWLGVTLKKIRYLFNTYEGPDNYDYSFSRKFSFLLRLPLFTFGIIGPLALAGMYLGYKNFKNILPLYVFTFIYAFSLLLFFIFSRFRIYLVPVLAVFAGYGLVSIGGIIKRRDFKKLAKAILLLTGFAVVFHLPVKRQEFTGSYNTLGCIYSAKLMHKEAIEAYEKAIDINGQMPELWYNLANSYMNLAKESEANEEPEEKLNELFAKARRFSGIAYFNYNRFKEALQEFKLSLEYLPGNEDTLSYAGITCFYLKDYMQAEKYLQKSLDMNPELFENRKALAMIYEGYDTAGAIRMWESCMEKVPDYPDSDSEKKLIVERIEELRKKKEK